MDAQKIMKFFEEKEQGEFAEPFAIKDKDYELWTMDPDSVLNSYDAGVRLQTQEHGSDIRIVSNDLRINSDNIDSTLAEAEMQIVVRMAEQTGQDLRNEIGMLERLLTFALNEADVRLRRLVLPPLRESIIWFLTKRGWGAARILVEEKGKKGNKRVVFNFLPLDSRWLVYEIGSNGPLKLAYKTFRSGTALKSEYGYEGGQKNDNPVVDYWEYEGEKQISNTVVTTNAVLKEREVYPLRSMPFTIVPVAVRPPLSGTTGDAARGYGTSIFAAVRNLNAVRNRFVSMMATHANTQSQQGLINYYDEDGITLKTTTNVPGGVTNLPKGHNLLEPSPMRDIPATVVQQAAWLNNQIQQGILPDYRVARPPESGTRAAIALETGSIVFNPQLRALGYIYEDICRLIEEQLIDGGIKVKTKVMQGNEYYETEVKPIDLKKPHFIKVQFTSKPPWSEQVTAQLADMMERQGIPKAWIWENIYKFQDPKLLADLKALELYDNSPVGAMLLAADALIRVRDNPQAARSLIAEMDRMERAAQQPLEAAPTPPTAPAPTPTPPMPPSPATMPPGGGI